MADFVEENENEEEVNAKGPAENESSGDAAPAQMIEFSNPQTVVYCPTCTMPPEFCEFGAAFDKCIPWIMENCQEALSVNILNELLGNVSLEDAADAEVRDKQLNISYI